jgi:hypothetical protein
MGEIAADANGKVRAASCPKGETAFPTPDSTAKRNAALFFKLHPIVLVHPPARATGGRLSCNPDLFPCWIRLEPRKEILEEKLGTKGWRKIFRRTNLPEKGLKITAAICEHSQLKLNSTRPGSGVTSRTRRFHRQLGPAMEAVV